MLPTHPTETIDPRTRADYVASKVRPERGYRIVSYEASGTHIWNVYHEGLIVSCGTTRDLQDAINRARKRADGTVLTQNEVYIRLRAVGIFMKKDSSTGEYAVYPSGLSPRKREDVTYYTDDLQDALDTGLDMAKRWKTAD